MPEDKTFVKLKNGEKVDVTSTVQRRKYFRYATLLPLKLSEVDNPSAEAQASIVRDISGGGVRCISNGEFNEKTRVKCTLMIDDRCLIIIGVILVKQLYDRQDFKYQYRIAFVGLTDEDKEKIVQFIFDAQRKDLLKKKAASA